MSTIVQHVLGCAYVFRKYTRIPESSILVVVFWWGASFRKYTILASYSIFVFVFWWVVSFRKYTIESRITIRVFGLDVSFRSIIDYIDLV